MNRILGHSYDPPPEADELTVEDYVDWVSDLTRADSTDPDLFCCLVEHARNSLVLTRRLVTAIQILRDTGQLDRAVAFHLIALFVEWGIGEFTDKDPALCSAYDRMREVERTYGRKPEDHFRTYEAPPEWLAISEEWDRRADELKLELLRALCEPEMAAMRELRPEEFEFRCDQGRARMPPRRHVGA